MSLAAARGRNEPVYAARERALAERLGRPGARACDATREFVRSLGLPARLPEVGIGAERIPELARQWDGTGPIATNPRPARSAADLEKILRLAL